MVRKVRVDDEEDGGATVRLYLYHRFTSQYLDYCSEQLSHYRVYSYSAIGRMEDDLFVFCLCVVVLSVCAGASGAFLRTPTVWKSLGTQYLIL